MMTTSELDYCDAKCKTCKHRRTHKAGITYIVCDLYTYGTGLGAQLFKIPDDDFVCANWEQKEEDNDFRK